jgi:hypothetical protein
MMIQDEVKKELED